MPDEITEQLRSVTACPACGGSDASLVAGNVHRNRYGKILDKIGVPLTDMAVRRCRDCGSAWRDPWPVAAILGRIYREAEPCHPAGAMTHREGGVLRRGPARLHDFFTRHVAPFESYGEFGCPAWGLLPYYGTRRFRAFSGLVDIEAGATVGPATVGQSANHPSRIVRLLCGVVGLTPLSSPQRLATIRADIELFWGEQCHLNGVSCFDAVRAQTGAKPSSPEDLAAAPVDVLSLVLVLDHYHRPAELLARAAHWARFIFVFTHGASDYSARAPQHLVNFSADGLIRLGRRAGLERVAEYLTHSDARDFGILFRSPRI